MTYCCRVDAASGATESVTLARIVQSARECFLRQGVRKTRIADVAAGAGMVRQTVYDSVSGRDELVDLALKARSREMADMVRIVPLNPNAAVGDQLVGMLAAMIELPAGTPSSGMRPRRSHGITPFITLVGPSPVTEVVVAPAHAAAAPRRERRPASHLVNPSRRRLLDSDGARARRRRVTVSLLIIYALRRTYDILVLPKLLRCDELTMPILCSICRFMSRLGGWL